jgi:hypothetical protein
MPLKVFDFTINDSVYLLQINHSSGPTWVYSDNKRPGCQLDSSVLGDVRYDKMAGNNNMKYKDVETRLHYYAEGHLKALYNVRHGSKLTKTTRSCDLVDILRES